METVKRIWTKDSVVEEAKKYNFRKEFSKKSPGAYQYAGRNKIIDEVCAHMELKYKYWNKGLVEEEVKKYSSKMEFKQNSRSAYIYACKNNILDEICSAMEIKRHKWTKESIKEIVKKYNTKKEFYTNSKGAYMYAWKNGFLDEICLHMEIIGNRNKRAIYIYKFYELKVFYVGLTYNYEDRNARHLNNSSNKGLKRLLDSNEKYELWQENIWYDINIVGIKEAEWIEKMQQEGWKRLNISKAGGLGGNIGKFSKEAVIEIASLYSSRKEFIKNDYNAYMCACQKKIINDIFKPLNNKWNYDSVKEEAKKYDTKSTFAKQSGGAYNYARRNKIIDEICQHMEQISVKNYQ